MIRRVVASALFSVALGVVSCSVGANDDGAPERFGHIRDGAICATRDGCRSGTCISFLCDGSLCRCEGGVCPESGAPSTDCEPGWRCAHVTPDDPLGFGIEPRDQCVAPCPTCPTNWRCGSGSFCEPEGTWSDASLEITATPENPLPGKLVHFSVVATSALPGATYLYAWKLPIAPGETIESTKPSFDAVLPASGRYTAEVEVRVLGGNASKGEVTVAVCGVVGDTCGDPAFGDVGCCMGTTCVANGLSFGTCE